MSGENVKTDQTSNQDSGAWSNFDNFAGERNVNDRTGKERTFSEFDLYPRQPGESSEEYGARLKDMHEKTAKYMAEQAAKEEASKAIIDAQNMRTKDYLGSDFGKKELDAEASYDRIADKLERAVQEGRMAKEHADRLLERKLNSSIKEIDGIRQDFEDSKTVGPKEDQENYEKWLEERGFKEKPATKKTTAEDDTPKSVEKSKVEEPKDAKEEKVDISTNVIDEAKERLIKELGPIIYDQVMKVVSGEVDRIFSGITLESTKEIVGEPAPKAPEAPKENPEEARTKESILAEINESRSRRGEATLDLANKEAELKKYDQGMKEIRAELQKRGASEVETDAMDLIRSNSDKIGGDKGISILTSKGFYDEKFYEDWWDNNLDDNGRKTVRKILKSNSSDNSNISKRFLNWLAQHDKEEGQFSGQAAA